MNKIYLFTLSSLSKAIHLTFSFLKYYLLAAEHAYRRCHEKTSYVSNYAFFTLLHKWVDRRQTHHFEKLQ